MTAKDDITKAAADLVRELVVHNTTSYEAKLGPVIDQGSGHNYGSYRVKVEKVEG